MVAPPGMKLSERNRICSEPMGQTDTQSGSYERGVRVRATLARGLACDAGLSWGFLVFGFRDHRQFLIATCNAQKVDVACR